jgi:hypothetical protein
MLNIRKTTLDALMSRFGQSLFLCLETQYEHSCVRKQCQISTHHVSKSPPISENVAAVPSSLKTTLPSKKKTLRFNIQKTTSSEQIWASLHRHFWISRYRLTLTMFDKKERGLELCRVAALDPSQISKHRVLAIMFKNQRSLKIVKIRSMSEKQGGTVGCRIAAAIRRIQKSFFGFSYDRKLTSSRLMWRVHARQTRYIKDEKVLRNMLSLHAFHTHDTAFQKAVVKDTDARGAKRTCSIIS